MTTPTGPYALPLHYLREGLAASAAFRTATGANNAAAARPFVHYAAAPGNTRAPCAIVDVGSGWNADAHAAGGRNEFVVQGEVWCTLLLAVDPTKAEGEQDLAAYNAIGAIAADLLADAGKADRLDITGLRIGAPLRPDEKLRASLGDYVQADMTITYRSFA
ncbi:MAG: hypothetical protein KF878_00130 [Planctomycetes bacterium]|nr:hypothetical protein [Planctomycetota bacterium]